MKNITQTAISSSPAVGRNRIERGRGPCLNNIQENKRIPAFLKRILFLLVNDNTTDTNRVLLS